MSYVSLGACGADSASEPDPGDSTEQTLASIAQWFRSTVVLGGWAGNFDLLQAIYRSAVEGRDVDWSKVGKQWLRDNGNAMLFVGRILTWVSVPLDAVFGIGIPIGAVGALCTTVGPLLLDAANGTQPTADQFLAAFTSMKDIDPDDANKLSDFANSDDVNQANGFLNTAKGVVPAPSKPNSAAAAGTTAVVNACPDAAPAADPVARAAAVTAAAQKSQAKLTLAQTQARANAQVIIARQQSLQPIPQVKMKAASVPSSGSGNTLVYVGGAAAVIAIGVAVYRATRTRKNPRRSRRRR